MRLLGVKIDNVSMREALDKVKDFLYDGRQHYIVLPYSEFLVNAQRDRDFFEILNRADMSLSDGVGPILAARFQGESLKGRVRGVDLIGEMAKVFGRDFPFFFFGSGEGVAQKAAENLKVKYNGLNVAGTENGYVSDTVVIDNINRMRPEILFVALGSPKQEKWIAANLSKLLSVKIAIGVGGAFDFLSGNVRRAPVFMQRIGLEWLWRLILEPKRLPRIFKAIVIFPALIVKDFFK